MLHTIYIIEKKSGRAIFSKSYEFSIDETLISGFLSALYGFAQAELEDKGVDNIDMYGNRFVYADNRGLLYIGAAGKQDSAQMLHEQIIRYKGVLTKLNLDRDIFLDKICLLVRLDDVCHTVLLQEGLLLSERQVHYLVQMPPVCCHAVPIYYTVPPICREKPRKFLIQRPRIVKALTPHCSFFAHFC